MIGKHLLHASAILLVAAMAPACTSRDERASTAAAIAGDALAQGNIALAQQQIGVALAARDDVSDYWLLSARIAMAAGSYAAAFDAYENTLTLDRTNAEALTRMCQIALSGEQPQRAERYAAQLLTLRPGDPAATTVQAALALDHGDKAEAKRLLDIVLAATPGDPLALLVRSRLLTSAGDYRGAAAAVETSLAAPGDLGGRLVALRDIYRKAGDAAGWRRTVRRLAETNPQSFAAQLDDARSRYDAGDTAGGLAAARRALALRPDDIANAGRIAHLWAAQGRAAMPTEAIVRDAAGGSAEIRAAYAVYANAIGRPDLALNVLGTAAQGDPATPANADLKAARAHARVLVGTPGPVGAEIAAVLAADPDQPRALIARGALRVRTGDRRGAIEDLRRALAGDPADATTRLALAELQIADGDAMLAAATLGDGLDGEDADPRLAARLAALLRTQGRPAEAAGVITTYVRNNPFGRRPAA